MTLIMHLEDLTDLIRRDVEPKLRETLNHIIDGYLFSVVHVKQIEDTLQPVLIFKDLMVDCCSQEVSVIDLFGLHEVCGLDNLSQRLLIKCFSFAFHGIIELLF